MSVTSFICGFCVASLISTIALACYDNHESDFTFYLAGGPCLWAIGLFALAYRTIHRETQHYNCKSVVEDYAGRLWYCDSKWYDTVLTYSDKYKRPDARKYQDYVKLWCERVRYDYDNYYRVSFRYAPKKFWKKYANPIPKEEIWLCQQKEEAMRHTQY